MQIKLDQLDSKRIEQLHDTMEINRVVAQLLNDFVANHSTYVTLPALNQLREEYGMSSEMAFSMLMSAACGLDTAQNQIHKQLFNDYFLPSVKCLSPKDYADDIYLKTILLTPKTIGNISLAIKKYQPCEAFVIDNAVLSSDFREFPQIGFFTTEYEYPVLTISETESISLTPKYIDSAMPYIEDVRGNVLVHGLGLGYFPFMASQKKSVKKITVVEPNIELTEFFTTEILPQFPNKEKVEITTAAPADTYDYTFTDPWQKSRLSHLRTQKFNTLYTIFKQQSVVSSNENDITSYNEFIKLLSDNELVKQ